MNKYRIVERKTGDVVTYEPQVRFFLLFWSGWDRGIYNTINRTDPDEVSSSVVRFYSLQGALNYIAKQESRNVKTIKTIYNVKGP